MRRIPLILLFVLPLSLAALAQQTDNSKPQPTPARACRHLHSFEHCRRQYERTYQEYLHHLSMAQASLAEVGTQLEIATRLRYMRANQLTEILEISSPGKQLYASRNSLLGT